MTYSISSISNRDCQLLFHYRILRQPVDLLQAVFRMTEPVEVVFKFEAADSASVSIAYPGDEYVPLLEFEADTAHDFECLESYTSLDVVEGRLVLNADSEIACDQIVKVHWCSTSESITRAIVDVFTSITSLKNDVKMLKENVENLEIPIGGTQAPSGVDDNLIAIGVQEDGTYYLKDSSYAVESSMESQTFLNPTQEELAALVKYLDKPIRIETTDGHSRILENFYGEKITIVGEGEWICINNRCDVVFADFNGSIYARDCTHLRTSGDSNSIALVRMLNSYLTHKKGHIQELHLARQSSVKHSAGSIGKLLQVGIACTYCCQAGSENEPQLDWKRVQGTAILSDRTIIMYGYEVTFRPGNTDIPLMPTDLEVEVDVTIPGTTPDDPSGVEVAGYYVEDLGE